MADTGASLYLDAPRNIKVWDVVNGKRLAKGREFASREYQGIPADLDSNVWASAGWVGDGHDGVHIFAPNDDRIGLMRLPEICSNVCLGGTKRNRLFMTGRQSLYAVYAETQGVNIT